MGPFLTDWVYAMLTDLLQLTGFPGFLSVPLWNEMSWFLLLGPASVLSSSISSSLEPFLISFVPWPYRAPS